MDGFHRSGWPLRFGWPLGGLAFGLTASAFRHAPLRRLPLGELAFGLTASAFRHAPLRKLPSAGWPSGSRLPLFDTHRFGDCPRRVGLRAHDFRFSARTASGLPSAGWFCRLPLRRLPLGGLTFGLPFPFFGTHRFGVAVRQVGASAGRVGLRVRSFRFSARAASGLPLVGLAFGLTASAFRHAPLRGYPRRVGSSAFRFGVCHSAGWPSGSRLPLFGTHRFGVATRRVGLRAHRFRFSARTASGLPSASWFFCLLLRSCRSAGWPSGSRLPLFGMRRFGDCPRRVGSSAFRFGDCRSAGWPSGSRLPLFGTHRSAPPHRRREGRRSTPTRHLFHFKTLIPTC